MRRFLFIFLLLLVALEALVGFATNLQVNGGTVQVFSNTVSIPSPTQTLAPIPIVKSSSTPTVTPTPALTPEAWDNSNLEFTNPSTSCDNGGTIWITVQNVGKEMAGGSYWALYLDGRLLESESFPALGSGEVYKISVNIDQFGNYQFKGYQRPGIPGKAIFWSNEIPFDPQACSGSETELVFIPTSTETLTPTATLTQVEEACVKTLNFWISHSEEWPMETLTLSGKVYILDEMLAILETQVENEVTYFLAQQLIVAELNLENGIDGSTIDITILEVDNWLREHPLGSHPPEPLTKEGYELAISLGDFNHGLLGPQLCSNQIVPTYPALPLSPPNTPSPMATLTNPPVETPTTTPTEEILETPTLALSLVTNDTAPTTSTPVSTETAEPTANLPLSERTEQPTQLPTNNTIEPTDL